MTATSSAALEALQRSAADTNRRILLRRATVLTMDAAIPDLRHGDVLVEGSAIASVGADLSAAAGDGQALVIDLDGSILVPGLCDAHRHCWQNQFRRLLCDTEDLDTYMASTHGGIALHYEPEDIYVGNLVTLLAALDSGVTCLLDFSHNSRTAAHSDAAFRAYGEAGARAVHASAPPNAGAWDEQWPGDIDRLLTEHCPPGRLSTVRMGIDMRIRATPELVRRGREMGVGVSIDGVMGAISSSEIERLGEAGALGPDVTLIHCTSLSARAWEHIAVSGARVTLAPTSDEHLGLADGLPPIQRCLDLGIRPSLSVDVEVALSSDLFTQMRTVMTTQRLGVASRRHRGEEAPPMVTVRDVLGFATAAGARDVGLDGRIGTISPGKEADLVAISAEDVNNLPLNSAAGTVVLGADPRNVHLVLVAGQVRKYGGGLVGLDLDRIRRLARDSRDRILEEAGFELDILAEARGYPEGSRRAHRGLGVAGGATPEWGPTPPPEAASDGAAGP